MKASEKTRSALYEAISEPIMKSRIDIGMNGSPSSEQMDNILYSLEREIWAEVRKALNIFGKLWI